MQWRASVTWSVSGGQTDATRTRGGRMSFIKRANKASVYICATACVFVLPPPTPGRAPGDLCRPQWPDSRRLSNASSLCVEESSRVSAAAPPPTPLSSLQPPLTRLEILFFSWGWFRATVPLDPVKAQRLLNFTWWKTERFYSAYLLLEQRRNVPEFLCWIRRIKPFSLWCYGSDSRSISGSRNIIFHHISK